MHDTIQHNIDRNKSKLHEMAALGAEYREDVEIEVYGEPITLVIKPMPDKEFLPLLAYFDEKFDYDEEMSEYAASEAIDEVSDDDAIEVSGDVDVSEMDKDFVETMQEAAIKGMHGVREDGDVVTFDSDEEKQGILEALYGGTSVELGGLVLKVTGDARDADKFR